MGPRVLGSTPLTTEPALCPALHGVLEASYKVNKDIEFENLTLLFLSLQFNWILQLKQFCQHVFVSQRPYSPDCITSPNKYVTSFVQLANAMVAHYLIGKR